MSIDLIEIIKDKYPDMASERLADELGLSIHQLRRIVSRNKIKKSANFLKNQHNELLKHKKLSYIRNKIEYIPSPIQENIIIGSLLGDGTLSKYGRSKESHYREHGCREQSDYRKWKFEHLKNLDFKFFEHYKYPEIKSPSHYMYSEYHKAMYKNGTKTISKEIISKLNHPIGLLCLYLDDGTLVIDRYKRKNRIHLFPRVTLYTQSFTLEENDLLQKHIEKVFGIKFIKKSRKDGHGVVLQCNYRDDIIKFLEIINNNHPLLDCMKHKLDLNYALERSKKTYQKRFPKHDIIIDRIEKIQEESG